MARPKKEKQVETVIEIPQTEENDIIEVSLKNKQSHKGCFIVFIKRGNFVEFNDGKAKVDASTKAKLEEIGVI